MEIKLNDSLYNIARFIRNENYFNVDLSLTDFSSYVDDIRNVVFILKMIRAVNMTVKELNDKLKKTTIICHFVQIDGVNLFSIKFNDKNWNKTTSRYKTINPSWIAGRNDISFDISTTQSNQHKDFWDKQIEPKFIDLLADNFQKITDELDL